MSFDDLHPTHPGRRLRYTLAQFGLDQNDVTGLSAKHLSHLCTQKVRLTGVTAAKLERVLPFIPGEKWVTMQAQWDLRIERGQLSWDEYLDQQTLGTDFKRVRNPKKVI